MSDTPSGPPPLKKRRITFAEPSKTTAAYVMSRKAMGMNTHITTERLKEINLNCYVYALTPPSISSLLETVESSGIPSKIYQRPYYSNPNDVPEKPRAYGGVIYRLHGNHEYLKPLDDWQENNASSPINTFTDLSLPYSSGWEYGGGSPPSVRQVKMWLASEEARAPPKKPRLGARSQVSLTV